MCSIFTFGLYECKHRTPGSSWQREWTKSRNSCRNNFVWKRLVSWAYTPAVPQLQHAGSSIRLLFIVSPSMVNALSGCENLEEIFPSFKLWKIIWWIYLWKMKCWSTRMSEEKQGQHLRRPAIYWKWSHHEGFWEKIVSGSETADLNHVLSENRQV